MNERTRAIQSVRPEQQLAGWCKDLRKNKLRLTQKQLAARTDIPLGTIRYFEQTGRASLQNFLRIVAELDVLDFFLGNIRDGSEATSNTIHQDQDSLPLRGDSGIRQIQAAPSRKRRQHGIRKRMDAAPETSVSDSLACKIGIAPHISPLLRKLAKHGMKTPEEMAACAVARGCRHYANMPNWKNIRPISAPEISNEELAIGLLSPCHAYEPLFIRVSCQLLSAPETKPETLTRLALMERCAPVLKHIATCGKETEPENPFWKAVLDHLGTPERPQPEFPAKSIHISRFRVETGITNPFRPNIPKTVWLRPQHNA